METIQYWDEQIVLAVNRMHLLWLDSVMMVITQTAFWTPLFLLIIYLLFKTRPMKDAWSILAGVLIAIVISDQTTASLMKPFFERLRPSHHPALSPQLHFIEGYKGGLYGFASSHAANAFALATVLTLAVGATLRGIRWLFLWAALMSFTRLYLSVHYLTDLLAGACVGIVAGAAGFLAIKYLRRRWQSPVSQTPLS
jgi:undecaprenyl-diphosphatase